jgi:hypothetical protein
LNKSIWSITTRLELISTGVAVFDIEYTNLQPCVYLTKVNNDIGSIYNIFLVCIHKLSEEEITYLLENTMELKGIL